MIEEILDLVDDNDNVIGQMARNDVYKRGLKNFRVINVFLKNDKAELWIPRRTAQKSLFPLHLDLSTGGHVESGESYDEAMQREVLEEINLDVNTVEYTTLGHLKPNEHDVSAFMKVYEIKTNTSPNFNSDDYVEGNWMMPKNVLARLENGDKGKSDLPKIIKHFYA